MKLSRDLIILALGLILVCTFYSYNMESESQIQDRLLQLTTYTTTSTRLELVGTACAGKDRTTMVSEGAQAENANYRADLATQFQLDP